MSFRPALVDPQGGPITGKEGGPMSLAKPASNWSHVTDKRHITSGQLWRRLIAVNGKGRVRGINGMLASTPRSLPSSTSGLARRPGIRCRIVVLEKVLI
jgi:hypothetical protein